MQLWKRNLAVCWFGMFVTGIGMSQIAPVLPLYIEQLGIYDPAAITQLSGIAFGITFVVSAIFSPIWGQAADKIGRKPMLLRASLGMAIIIGSMGFAPNVYILIAQRILLGAVTGYCPACTTLIAVQTDKAHAGWALGTLSTANIAGGLLGPTIGGFLEENIGLQSVFFFTGALMLIAFLTSTFFVHEEFTREEHKVQRFQEVWHSLPEKGLTMTVFITFWILSIALYSAEPIMTVYISQLAKGSGHVALLAGLTFSASGLANILAAPRLGKLSDRVGAHKVMLVSLIAAGAVFIPQAFVATTWQLMALRFLLGLTSAGLAPSINIIVKKITPSAYTGRIFGFTTAAGNFGVFCGSVLGGQVSAGFGIRHVFFITSALLFINAVWAYFKVYRRLEAPKKKEGFEKKELVFSGK